MLVIGNLDELDVEQTKVSDGCIMGSEVLHVPTMGFSTRGGSSPVYITFSVRFDSNLQELLLVPGDVVGIQISLSTE